MTAAIAAVVADYDADVYLYSGPIDDRGYGKLVSALTSDTTKKNALLILTTNGGHANAALVEAKEAAEVPKVRGHYKKRAQISN